MQEQFHKAPFLAQKEPFLKSMFIVLLTNSNKMEVMEVYLTSQQSWKNQSKTLDKNATYLV